MLSWRSCDLNTNIKNNDFVFYKFMMEFFLKLTVGSVAAIVGYALARRFLDAIGMENWFRNSIWHYTVSQFGEIILLAFVIAVVLLIGFAFDLFKNILGIST